jgi:sodium-dependent phosphate cotransporter
MIGILVTVAVQSSATSTSIIVALVSAGAPVKNTIPMIFGSNVGTSVTNTIVSMTQAGDREAFRRAFAAATVHDMFNWLSVIVLTILELSTGFLEISSEYMVNAMLDDSSNSTEALKKVGGSSPDLLKPLTKPLTNLIIQVDRQVLIGWSFQDEKYANVTSILKTNETYLLALLGEQGLGWSDVALGIILLVVSLVMLCGCLIVLMKILNSMLGTQMAILIQKTINAKIPYVPWLTGYFAMLLGCVITILVRSSSVFTSTLTPLCGTGLVTLETAYPMTLGSNIGTTTTSILASFAADGQYLKPSVQISLVHLLFNLAGITLFYPIPFMRWPVGLAQILGDTTANYRWFAGFYLAGMFVFAPLFVFTLSLAGTQIMYAVLIPIMILGLIVVMINVIQNKRSHWLPHFIRDFSFLPLWMRSLKPLDDLFSQLSCCSKCINPPELDSNPDIQDLRDVESAMLRFSGHNEKTEFHHINHMGEEMQVLVNCTPGNQEKQRQETEAAISRQEA